MKTFKNTVTTEHRFDSPAELVSAWKGFGKSLGYISAWSGGLREDQIFAKLRTGDDQYVDEAKSLIEDIMRGLRLESLKTEWVPDMAGAYADVPSFLAGDPACMRRRVTVSKEIAPLKLFVCLTSSCGVSTDVLKKRGICLLALVIALTRVRPVELYTFNAISKHDRSHQSLVDVVKMPIAPLDIGLISFCLVNQSFTRSLCYSYLTHHEYGVLYNPPNKDVADLKLIVGAGDNDVVFPPIHLYDNYRDPKAWVKEQLGTILKLNEEQMEALT